MVKQGMRICKHSLIEIYHTQTIIVCFEDTQESVTCYMKSVYAMKGFGKKTKS